MRSPKIHSPISTEPVLPDVLLPGLAVVFCGTAAGRVSAARGQYYAHPQNKFWRTLHAIGLTPELLAPREFERLRDYRIGLTDIAKHTFGMDKDLPPQSLGKSAVAALRQRIAEIRPGILAFTSLTGGRSFLGSQARLGRQAETIGETELWILPSPSPAASFSWDEGVWRQLAARVAERSR